MFDLREHMRGPLIGHLLFDRLEWMPEADEPQGVLEVDGWLGYDFNRLWLRADGAWHDGSWEQARVDLYYGRAFARWWEALIGLRRDDGEGQSPRHWLGVGIQGLAPYWLETELTAYFTQGQQALELELEREFLITNRLILQGVIEAGAHLRDEPERLIGAGFTEGEAGLRLRYLIKREFAPYIGWQWERAFGDSADLIEAAGGETSESVFVAGLRVWF